MPARRTRMADAPGSTTSLRSANQQRVLDFLLGRGDHVSVQADIVRETGLASGTVSSIVRQLADADVLSTVAGSGRRGTTVRLARGAGLVAGVDFGHTHLSVAISEMSGHIIAETRERIDPNHDHQVGLKRARHLLDQQLREHDLSLDHVHRVGMGLPAPVVDGVVLSSVILPGWVGVSANALGSETFGKECLVDNDANLAALAEHRNGAGRGHHNLVFVKISSGVGAGLIINDQLFRGSSGAAGEIGHLTVDDQGPLCRCGSRGCLEVYASVGTTMELLHTQLPGASLAEIIAAAGEGNGAAVRAFEDAGLHLGWGLAMVANLVDPGIIVVGGDMAQAGELLLASARVALRRHSLSGGATKLVVPAELGERASLIGALTQAIDATDLLAMLGEC